MEFDEMNLCAPLLKAVRSLGYTTPTPIQQKAIPHVMAGRDVMGCAQTGTGKTAAFALPILHNLNAGPYRKGKRPIRCLMLAPTRELASQIADNCKSYGMHIGLRGTVLFGGVNQYNQVRALKRGVDILVATPGRLLDLMNQGHVDLSTVEVFVLDEADRMLDMGFINDIRRISKALPGTNQTLLFSATLEPKIRELASRLLDDPVSVSVAPAGRTVDLTEQRVCHVAKPDKQSLLVHILQNMEVDRTLVFMRTKYGADKVVRKLQQASIAASAIHGNKSQSNRERALAGFKRGDTRVLVATDIASRGLDIEQLNLVINFDLPNEAEAYVHRIGRTGRAGCVGNAISFCDREERSFLQSIERLIKMRIDVWEEHPFHVESKYRSKPRQARNNNARSGARPGARSGARPGARPGQRPGQKPGQRPNQRSGQRPGQRPSSPSQRKYKPRKAGGGSR